MLRKCAPTVFGETDSSPAISGRDRFVGRYPSTLRVGESGQQVSLHDRAVLEDGGDAIQNIGHRG